MVRDQGQQSSAVSGVGASHSTQDSLFFQNLNDLSCTQHPTPAVPNGHPHSGTGDTSSTPISWCPLGEGRPPRYSNGEYDNSSTESQGHGSSIYSLAYFLHHCIVVFRMILLSILVLRGFRLITRVPKCC